LNNVVPAFAIALLAAAAAQAENTISVTDRTDLRSQIFDDSSGRQSNNQFDIQYLRVDFKGDVTDDMKYRLRVRLDKTSVKDGLKGVSDFVSYAYVEPKFSDVLSVRVGKVWTYQAGWEEDNSSADVYLFSGIDDVAEEYALGVNPTLTFGKQKIQIVVTNSDVAYASDAKSSRFFRYGAAYQGDISGFQPMLSLAMMPETGWSKGTLIAAAGLKVDPAPIGGELDVEYAKDNIGSDDEDLLTFAGTVRYRTGAFGPQLKLFYDTYTSGSETTGNVFGIAPAIEYFPWTDHDFRIHLAYTGKNTSPKHGTSTYDQQVFLGVKGSWSMK